MASDLSSGCAEAVEVLDEKEEGEISLEDVSSSEEGHLNYGYGIRTPQCSSCLSTQHCTSWCTAPGKLYHPRNQSRREVDLILQDAVQGKENRHHVKESGCTGAKHTVSTLQEKNDDLVPISSDSDMEIVGLADNSKQVSIRAVSKTRTKKKRKKKRNHPPTLTIDDLVTAPLVDMSVTDCVGTLKHDDIMMKGNPLTRSHHRELSPVHRSGRSRPVSRSPPRRHRSPMRTRSPFKKSRSPFKKARSPIIRTRKRSPYRSPVKTISRKVPQIELSVPHGYVDAHGNVNKLLKKVRQLDSVGTHSLEVSLNKNKEHASSLKEKLSNMMKSVSDNNGNVTNYSKEKSNVHVKEVNDADDEEDLALLRQKALETKQKKLNKRNDQPRIEPVKKVIVTNDDDQDEEDLELRMIALRSAVLKKHQNRVQRGMKSGKSKKYGVSRSESPFTQSFLDSIPIPGEELLNFASPPHTPPPMNESNHTEDMELDTDVEREKEKLLYSPTDKITSDIPIDTELLGIQPSDVSFISLNDANNSPVFGALHNKLEPKPLQTRIIENQSYLPNTLYYAGQQNTFYETPNVDVPSSPSDSTQAARSDFTNKKKHNSHIATHRYSEPPNILKSAQGSSTRDYTEVNSSQEMPYSPTDTPVYDPDLSQMLPQTSGPVTTSDNSSMVYNSGVPEKVELSSEMNNIRADGHSDKVETFSLDPAVGSAATSLAGSVSPTSSMITIDDLPETDIDVSPPTDALKDAKCTEYIPDNQTQNVKGTAPEPLYMQGVPDITKDINKIPTLINRTLVPAPILKSNKQLQQPMPAKKHEAHPEPTFKSAEMQPVPVNNESAPRTSTIFKPMKLIPIAQKSQSVLTTPVAFHESLNEDLPNETPSPNTNTSSLENKDHNKSLSKNTTVRGTKDLEESCDITVPVHKKKKCTKKGFKRKSISTAQTIAKKINVSCKSKDNAKDIDMRESIVEKGMSSKSKESNKQVECNIDQQSNTETNKKLEEHKKGSDTENTESNITNSQSESVDQSTLAVTENKIMDVQNPMEKSVHSETANVNEKLDKSASNLKTNLNNGTGEAEQTKNVQNRRQSLEEDEEALRAILLASLPKRTKPADNISSNATTVATAVVTTVTTSVSNVNNKTPMNQLTSAMLPAIQKSSTCGATVLPLQSQNSNVNVSESDKSHNNSSAQINNTVPTKTDLPDKIIPPTVPAISGRKRPVLTTKGPPKKITRKISIPASTKVVNNAKKYQNSIVQKRLNLQKAAMLYTNQKVAENKSLCKVPSGENKWPTNAKTPLLSDTQRIVINLESDTESDSESERQRNKTASLSNSAGVDKHPSVVNPAAEFEKNVVQFLRDVRKKQESAARPTSLPQAGKKDKTSPTQLEKTNPSNLHTPLAVRHLPASQQEEYRRLKQQIIEREKLRLRRTIENNASSKNKTVAVPPKFVLSDSLNKKASPPKVGQPAPAKSQNANAQQPNKENSLRNADSPKSASAVIARKVQAGANKVSTPSKQVNSGLFPSKTMSKSMTNLSIQIPNEISSGNNGNKTSANASPSAITSRTVLESSTPLQEVSKIKMLSGLKILSRDEVNRKFVQIQVKHDTNGRVVIINNKETLSEKEETSRNDRLIEDSSSVDKELCDPDISRIVETVENEIVNNDNQLCNGEEIDSDASTVVLSKGNLQADSKDSLSITESTMTLSQYQEENQILMFPNTESNDSDNSQSSKCTIFDNKGSIEKNWESTRKDVKTELNALMNLSRMEQQKHLIDTEQKLVMKRYRISDELTEMSGSLRQWHMERDLQTNLVAEVKKLREQLRIAEERLQLQRNRINSIGPKVVAAHEKIIAGRQECFKLSKVCSVLGTRIIGKDYKVPEAGAQLLDSRLKEVANHTRQLSKKKVPSIDIPEIYATPGLHQNVLHASFISESVTNDDDPLFECNEVDDNETIASNENDASTELNDSKVTLELDSTLVDSQESGEVEVDVPTNGCTVHENEQSISEEDNNSLNVQPELSSTPVVSKVCTESQDKQLESTRPGTSSEPCNIKLNFGKPETEQQTKKAIVPYVSVLTHLKVPRNTNPNGVLCPYELMGTCNDGDCQFVHQSESQAK